MSGGMSSGNGEHVAIVGGGVIGAMCAWYLSDAGFRVTVVDRQRFGAACSHGNCGFICPSHVLPLAQPGAVASTLRAMLRPTSPFAIKPRLSADFVSWFWHFYRQSNTTDMLVTGAARHTLLQSSMALYRDLVAESGIDCEWQERGLLFVFDHEREFDEYQKTDKLLRAEFGVGATAYSSAELVTLEPALKSGFGGGWHYEDDCHIRPDKLMAGLRARLEARGVTFEEDCTVDGFVREAGRAIALRLASGAIEATHFVVATGAMTPFLNKELGVRIPIEPGKGYSITMPRPARAPVHPIIFDSSHVAITPMASGYRIGSTMEFVGYDTSINPKRLRLLTDAAAKYLHEPYGDSVEEEWFGWRPMTWDGKPVIDRSPIMDNVWIAAGHGMLGVSMAPGTGRLVAELMTGGTPHIDPDPFAVNRFRGAVRA